MMRYLERAPDAPIETETALIVPIPEADPLVGPHRERSDPAAGWGIPAHVTVLYPFVPPLRLGPEVQASVAGAIGSVAAFDCRFARTRWFGDDVLWLAPEPAQPFARLTAAVWTAFPDHPPYGGAHTDVVPHVTVGQRSAARSVTAGTLRAAEGQLLARLPVAAHVDRALLVAGSDAPLSWHTIAEFRLGRPPGG